jgi:hypothetical protein
MGLASAPVTLAGASQFICSIRGNHGTTTTVGTALF